MKALPYIFTSALALVVLLATVRAPASGASNWDAMGEINSLKEQIAELSSKVRSLEAQIQSVEQKQTIIIRSVPAPTPSTERPLIQVTPQEDILQVFKRGMFVPANR